MKVFVIDSNKQPLDPCSAGKARRLLAEGKAAVYRRYPFTIILHREVEKSEPQPLRFKIDPGAKTSGLTLVNDQSGEVVWAAELQHRGWQIKEHWKVDVVYEQVVVDEKPVIVHLALIIDPNLKGGYHLP